MREDERVWAVKEALFDYLRSPSLKHMRDPHAVAKLAQDIVRRVDRGNSIWMKWDGQREVLLKSALQCWIPLEDMREFLNRMPGPALTLTDVTQRFRALEEMETGFARQELQAGCLALYVKEKGEGTELPAIVQLLRDYIDREEERLRIEQEAQYKRWQEEDRSKRERRLLSGADCGWTQLQKSAHWFCRTNGRTYRASPTPDKKWHVFRIQSVSETEEGELLGRYQGRGDATKALKKMAYEPEPSW